MITFIPYICIEIPSNMVMKKIGARWMLPALCISWGIVTTLQCLMQGYSGLIACRFFIGLCEGGVFPGFVLYLSEFYRRDEIHRRIALLYGGASIAGAFSGLLAAAIEKMNGIGGLAGWRWIFLLEGLITVIFGFIAFFLMPNTPKDVFTFTEEQKDYCLRRLASDSKVSDGQSAVQFKHLWDCLKDPHFWNVLIMSFAVGFVAQGVSYFTPSVVLTFGFSTTNTQLLTVPPFMFAFFSTMIASFMSDRYHCRGLVSIATAGMGVIGCILNFCGSSLGLRYTSLFLLVAGIYSCAPTVLAWIPNNSAGYGKRACAVAIGFVVSNAGGVAGVWIYPTKDAPRYLYASKFNISFLGLTLVLAGVQILLLRNLNSQKVQKREETLSGVEHLSLSEQMEVLGDRHPEFKYIL